MSVLCRTIAINCMFNSSSYSFWFSGLYNAGVKTLFELKLEIGSLDSGRHLNTFKLFPRERWNYSQSTFVLKFWSHYESKSIYLTCQKERKSRNSLSSRHVDLLINFLWFLYPNIYFHIPSFLSSSSIFITSFVLSAFPILFYSFNACINYWI